MMNSRSLPPDLEETPAAGYAGPASAVSPSWKKRLLSSSALRIAAGALLLGAFFLFFDRLFFAVLKSAVGHYYTSLAVKTFPAKESRGGGTGEALVFGSSRTRQAVDYAQLSAILNMRILVEAQAGIFPRYGYYFYEKFRRTRGRPRLVIFGLDYFEFEKESSLRFFIKLDGGVNLDILDPEGAINPASPGFSRLSWLYRLKPKIDDFLMDALRFERAEAGIDAVDPKSSPRNDPDSAESDSDPPTAIGSGAQPLKRQYQPFPGVEGRFLKALLDDLESEGIPSFLVIIPDHVNTNAVNFQGDLFRRDMQALASRFKYTRLLDFNLPEKFPLHDPTMFQEGGSVRSNCHLSAKGSKIFSDLLAREVKSALKDFRRTEQSGGEKE